MRSIDDHFDDSTFNNQTVAVLYASYANACCNLNELLEDDADGRGSNPLCEGVDFFEFQMRDELLAEIRRMKDWLNKHPHTVGRCELCAEPQGWELLTAIGAELKEGDRA